MGRERPVHATAGQPRRPPTPFPPWSPQVERVHSDGAVNPGAPGPHAETEDGTRKKAEAWGAGRRTGACQGLRGRCCPTLPSAVPTACPLGTQCPVDTVGGQPGTLTLAFPHGGPRSWALNPRSGGRRGPTAPISCRWL